MNKRTETLLEERVYERVPPRVRPGGLPVLPARFRSRIVTTESSNGFLCRSQAEVGTKRQIGGTKTRERTLN